MALSLRGFLALLGAWAGLSEQEDAFDVHLLQKSIHWDGRGRTKNVEVPELFVDLDLEPEKRWENVTRYYKGLGVTWTESRLTDEEQALLTALEIDEEYLRELRGIVAAFEEIKDPENAVNGLMLGQFTYELSGWSEGLSGFVSALPFMTRQWFANQAKETGCSGLLAAMPDGTVVHGRNMDYGGFEMEVEGGKVLHYCDVTIDVTFLRAGKPLMTSTHWPGQVGFHTAMRYDGWSFEQNTRFHGKDTSYIYGLLRGSTGYSLKARRIMETTPDFETAVTKLYDLNLMAPMYFIVAGPKPYQGAVITMDRGGDHAPFTPPVTRLSSAAPVLKDGQNYTGSWHIIQTNDDQGGLALDERRPTEEARLAQSTQDKVSIGWVRSQLTEPPIYNDATVFTTVYVPSTGYHKTLAHLEHQT